MKFYANMVALNAMLFMSVTFGASAQEIETQKEVANLLVLTEAAYATSVLIHERTDQDLDYFSWSSVYTDSRWILYVSSESPNWTAGVSITGYLWDEEDGDWSINYSGNGTLNGEPVVVHGRGVFIETERTDGTTDFVEMTFSQFAHIGKDSWWGWIKGAELVVGAAVAGAGGVIAAPVTGGASVVVGLAAAIPGAIGAATISNEVREILESNETVPPPRTPQLPPEPKANEPLVPREGQVMIAIYKNEEKIVGAGPNEVIGIFGAISNDRFVDGHIEIKN